MTTFLIAPDTVTAKSGSGSTLTLGPIPTAFGLLLADKIANALAMATRSTLGVTSVTGTTVTAPATAESASAPQQLDITPAGTVA